MESLLGKGESFWRKEIGDGGEGDLEGVAGGCLGREAMSTPVVRIAWRGARDYSKEIAPEKNGARSRRMMGKSVFSVAKEDPRGREGLEKGEV